METTIERQDIENTPFSAIHFVEEDNWQIAIANQIITTEKFKNKEDLVKYVKGTDEIPWELIMNATSFFTTYCIKQEEKIKTNSNN